MYKRITRKDVEGKIELFNKILDNNSAFYRIKFVKYNDYWHVDKYDANDPMQSLKYDAVFAGSMRECYTYVAAMIRGCDLFTHVANL